MKCRFHAVVKYNSNVHFRLMYIHIYAYTKSIRFSIRACCIFTFAKYLQFDEVNLRNKCYRPTTDELYTDKQNIANLRITKVEFSK